jgi:hypothetical protein
MTRVKSIRYKGTWKRVYSLLFLLSYTSNVEVEVKLRPTVSRPVCLGMKHPSATRDQFIFPLEISLDSCAFVILWRPLWREDGFVINCKTVSGPYQSSHSWVEVSQNLWPYFTVSSETPPTWKARFLYLYPPVRGWPSYTPRLWVPFCRLLGLAGLQWRYPNQPPHKSASNVIFTRRAIISGQNIRLPLLQFYTGR